MLGHPHGTVHGWWVGRAKLRVDEGNKLDKTTKGQGRKESFPFTSALLTYMKDGRRDEEFLTTSGMIAFIQENYPDWIEAYAENKKSDESCRRALERLLQRTADRYGFSTQTAQETKLPSVDLQRLKTDFAIEFWSKYGSYSLPEVYSMNETAIQFDMPPARTWAIKGRQGSAKIQNLTKHCGRMTAVLTVRADEEGMRVVAEQACATVVPLPAKATSLGKVLPTNP
ncbi:uncharacterized protein PITG_18702 [Phytophthora infestans T30-4]|uniref:Uncharacterized protein n=1 Tax=Phytophthora infestans (strain T30-4) TaxID=403677 RepID=D0NZ16_PHYIT|nr:uncharacterized protein PITG_18702 [Phytophthora infestans T30-4]EEY68803.1 conserved hypothetical protein [Phytophthora infestans T30-4]|eukprot:XP_002997353.1 conserved hypothetical protein [Phytophthora infestans T30-4]